MREDDPLFDIVIAKVKIHATNYANLRVEVKGSPEWARCYNDFYTGYMFNHADTEVEAWNKPKALPSMPVPKMPTP